MRAFTLVEVLLAVALTFVLFAGLFSFFGDTLQRFAQHEDTLTDVRDLQLLLHALRQDLDHLDGVWGAPSSAETGTTFPKLYTYLCHAPGDDRLRCFTFERRADDTPLPGNHPAAENLQPSRATARLLDTVRYVEAAAAFVPPDPAAPPGQAVAWLVLNVRDGAARDRVVYVWSQATRSVVRHAAGRTTTFGAGSVEAFAVRPVLELILFPGQRDRTAELVKAWYQVSLELRSAADGGRIAKRDLPFSTSVTPKFMNAAWRSRWSR